MEILRESLAISMFLLAIVKYNEKRYIGYFVYLSFAFLFHIYALILFAAHPFVSNRISNKIKYSILIFTILFLVWIDDPIIFPSSFTDAYKFMDLSFYDIDREMTVYGYLYNALRIAPVIFIIFLYNRNPLPFLTLQKETLFWLALLYIFIIIIRIFLIPFFDRLSNYFILFVILLVVVAMFDLVKKYIHQSFQFLVIVLCCFTSGLFYILPMMKVDPIFDAPTYKRYYPYGSVIFNDTDPDREYIIRLEVKE